MKKNDLSKIKFGYLLGYLAVVGCTNSVRAPIVITLPTPSASSTLTSLETQTAQSLNIKITTVKITENSGAAGAPATSIFFDTKTLTEGLPSLCGVASGGKSDKPCVCQFKWDEINGTTGIAVPHTVQTPLTLVQQSLVSCPGPDIFSTEIPDGTQIKITVNPTKDNSQQFSIPAVLFTKNSKVISGSFQDAQGRSFDNVLHYSCYEQFKKGLVIKSKIISYTNPNNGEIKKAPSASEFCLQKPGSVGAGTSGCEALPPIDNSAQANYFNLYIRDSERGDINLSNDRFICPQVTESLNTSSQNTLASQGQIYPLSSEFALSLGPSQDFPVGVVSATKVSNGQDPVGGNSSCFGSSNSDSSGSSGSTTSLVNSCLGFAAKPLSDGTCPQVTLPDSTKKNTFRLRRYVALYPPVFDAGGFPIDQPQGMDTVYVLDRPVDGSSDLSKPFTMKGPKPCPFAYYDKNKVVNGSEGYFATNNSDWTGKNIDGTQFPTIESLAQSGDMSCPAVIPYYKADKSMMGFGTLTSGDIKRFIRPVKAWAPHYEEDTEFQACAPQASPLRDPPLHLTRDGSGNVSWCAEVYPTKNPYSAQLPGATLTTTHAATGSGGSSDRTVVNSNLAWPRFPLLAPAAGVEAALNSDPSYNCAISYDGGKGKLGKTPSGGCCSSSFTTPLTGLSPFHLEPPNAGSNCAVPSY